MRRRTLVWLAAIAGIAVIVAGQVISQQRSGSENAAQAPAVRPGSDVLAGVAVVGARVRGSD